RHDGLLPGEHYHWHGAEMRVRGAGRQVERTRSKRRHANPRRAGEPPVGCRHEGSCLLMAGKNELDLGGAQRPPHIEGFLPPPPPKPPDPLRRPRPPPRITNPWHFTSSP